MLPVRMFSDTLLPSRMLMPSLGQKLHPIWVEIERRLRHLLNQPVSFDDFSQELINIYNDTPWTFFLNNSSVINKTPVSNMRKCKWWSNAVLIL